MKYTYPDETVVKKVNDAESEINAHPHRSDDD